MDSLDDAEKKLNSIMSDLAEIDQPGKAKYDDDAYKQAIILVLKQLLKPESKVLVYADFDPDGFFSGLILSRYLSRIGRIFHGEDHEACRLVFSNPQNGFGITEEEYASFKEEYSLIVTVDNGSAAPFLSTTTDKLLVIDHHPTSKNHPYIINPNANNDSYYSTSGGKVTYEFVKNMEDNIRLLNLVDGYPDEYHSDVVMGVFRDLSAFSLISDMATLDRRNREFVMESFRQIRLSPDRLPIFKHLKSSGGVNSRSVSFNIISQINAWRRMGKDLGDIVDWVAPLSYDSFVQVSKAVEKNNDEKKALVRSWMRRAKDEGEKINGIFFYGNSDIPVGLTGLIANQISQAEGKTPTIIAGRNDKGNVSLSARGSRAEEVLTRVFEDKEISGQFGGHPEACGGKLDMTEDDLSKLKIAVSKAGEALGEKKYMEETIFKEPVSIGTFSRLTDLYRFRSRGVDFSKKLLLGVNDFLLDGHHTYKSGWAQVALTDQDKEHRISFLVDTAQFPIDRFHNESGETVLVFELNAGDDLVLHSLYETTEGFNGNTSALVLAPEISGETEAEEAEEKYAEPIEEVLLVGKEPELREIEENPGVFYVFPETYREDEVTKKVRSMGNTIPLPVRRPDASPLRDGGGDNLFVLSSLQGVKDHVEDGDMVVFPESIVDRVASTPAIQEIIETYISEHLNENYEPSRRGQEKAPAPQREEEEYGIHDQDEGPALG